MSRTFERQVSAGLNGFFIDHDASGARSQNEDKLKEVRTVCSGALLSHAKGDQGSGCPISHHILLSKHPPGGGFGRGYGIGQTSRKANCRVGPVKLATKSWICSGTATPSMSQRV